MISCIIGLYFSPVGWSLAASLIAIITVGMIWPLVAVYATRLELVPEIDAVHEDAPCRMIVHARNCIPIPVWGLAVEGYLESVVSERAGGNESSVPLPTVGLASVPPMCQAEFGISVKPALRGQYPCQAPNVACSFPFGIWTARREIQKVSPLTVWPKIYAVPGLTRFSDKAATDLGIGSRSGRDGDHNGVREYRRGDSVKHVHWVASARTDTLMISERSAPQTAFLSVWLNTRIGLAGPDELSRRIRIAASIVTSLYIQNLPMKVHIGNQSVRIDSCRSSKGKIAFRSMLDEMAAIPAQGSESKECIRTAAGAWIEIKGDQFGSMVSVFNPGAPRRLGRGIRQWQVDACEDLTDAMDRFWMEVGHAETAA